MFFPTDKVSIEKRVEITSIDLTAEDWDLFSSDDAEQFAHRLNDALMACVNTGCDRETTTAQMRDLMCTPEGFAVGAGDSEPDYVLDDILNKIYG